MKCKSIKWGNTKTSGRQMTQGLTLCKTHKNTEIQKYITNTEILIYENIKWGTAGTSGRQMTQGSTLHKKQKNTEMNKCRNKKV